MRKLASGNVLARKLPLPEEHPAFEAFRRRLAARLAEERSNGGPRTWRLVRLEARVPSRSPDAEYVPGSGYELFEPEMLTPIGIALKSVYAERTGSWKTCLDFWLAIRTDGGWHKSKSLDGAARMLDRFRARRRSEAAARREDEDAIADLG